MTKHPLAVQIGAGNIGRGFIGQLFHESGLEVVFVDVVPEVIQAINSRKEYTIRIVGEGAEDVPITNIRAVDGRSDEAAEVLRDCAVASVSVGVPNLKYVAPTLAKGLCTRFQATDAPLNILVCENLHDASKTLRDLVKEQIHSEEWEKIADKVGFVQAVVSRMVPIQTREENGGDPLLVRVEAYKRLPVDKSSIVGEMPPLVGVEPVDHFEAYVARKLFIHNGAHAALGYLGYLKGYTYGYEALGDVEIEPILRQAMSEAGEALISKYGFEHQQLQSHSEDLLRRFANVELKDTCFRLARDPLRKLAPDDRLMGAVQLCWLTSSKPNEIPTGLCSVIGNALHFDAPEDPSAVELQRRIATEGVEQVIKKVIGLRPNKPLGEYIQDVYFDKIHTITRVPKHV